MARNRYPGYCYCCGKYTPTGYGHFERYHNGWRVKCVACASGRTVRDTDKEVKRAIKLRDEKKGSGNSTGTFVDEYNLFQKGTAIETVVKKWNKRVTEVENDGE